MSLNSSVQPAVPPGCQVNDLCLLHEMYLPFVVMFKVKLPDFLEWAPRLNNRRFVWKPAFAESAPTGVVRLSGSPPCVETSEDIQNARRGYIGTCQK